MSTIMTFSDEIAQRLKDERVRLGLSQATFAQRAGIHRNTQIKYESGDRQPDTTYWTAARAIGVDVGYVLTGEPLEKREKMQLDAVLGEFGRALATILEISDGQLREASKEVDVQMKAHNSCLESVGSSYYPSWNHHFLAEFLRVARRLLEQSPWVQRASAQELDSELLRQIIQETEQLLPAAESISAEKRARIITLVYRSCYKAGKVDSQAVHDAIALATN